MTLRLNGSTSGYTEIDAPAVAGSNTLVLPTGNGTNGQVLSTNGSGALSWVQGGRILQVVSTTKTDTFTTSSSSYTDLTGLSVTITPSSSTSKVLVSLSLCFTGDSTTQGYAKLVRGTTDIAIGDQVGSRRRFTTNHYEYSGGGATVPTAGIVFLDSPATTAATTYKVQLTNQGSGTVYVNRSSSYPDSLGSGTGISIITVMEVAA